MAVTTIWALLKVSIWAWLIFWVFARKVFRPRDVKIGPLASVLKMLFSTVVIVHGLALLNMLDTASVLVSFLALGFGRPWHLGGVRLRPALGLLSAKVHVAIFNILDGVVELRSVGRERAVGFLGDGVELKRKLFLAAPKVLAASFIFVGGIALRLPGISAYPYPETIREMGHLDIFKGLGAGNVFFESNYPTGAHAIAVMLRTTALLEESLLWKVLGLVLVLACALVAFCGVRLLSNRRSFGSPLFAAGLCVLFCGSSMVGGGESSTEVHPWHFAAPILGLAALLNISSLSSKHADFWGCFAAALLLGWLHPLALLLLFTALTVALIGQGALGGHHLRLKTVVKANALGLSLLALGCLTRWSLGSKSSWEPLLRELQAEPIQQFMLERTPLLVAGAVSALLLIILPERLGGRVRSLGGQTFGTFYLGCWSLAALPRLGLPQVFPTEGLLILCAPLASISIGLGLERMGEIFHGYTKERSLVGWISRWETAPAMAVLAVLLMSFPPQLALAKTPMESMLAMPVYEKISNSSISGTWTVVGHSELAHHVQGRGWFVSREDFLERFVVEDYRWDPRAPELSIPTQLTFFFVEKISPIDISMDEFSRMGREAANARLAVWCSRYSDTHDDMKVVHEDNALVVYSIHRSKKEERRKLGEIWVEDNLQSHPKKERK